MFGRLLCGRRHCGRPELRLREREWQVLELLADGSSTQQIAVKLSIAPATVRSHVSRLLEALDVGTRAEAVGLLRQVSA